MRNLFSLLFTLVSLTAFTQVPDTLTPEKKARYKISRIRDNSVRAITPTDFRGALNGIADMAASRTPYVTIKELRAGKADTANVVQVLNNNRVYTYKYEALSTALDDSALVIRNGNRRYVIDTEIITPQMFGARADGVSDDTRAIQKAVDFVVYQSKDKRVFIPSGTYKTTNTIHLGYGVNVNGSPYVTITIEGSAGGRATQGTKIVPVFRDRPVFSVSSGRQIRIRNIQFVGDSYTKTNVNLLHPNQIPGADNKSTWRNPDWPLSASSETAPFAAIAVDPYGGNSPTTPYPNVSFPSFFAGSLQYGKMPTSDLQIQDVVITGFEVGIVLSPSGSNQQTDFASFDKLWIEFCTYGISVSHTDCREVSLKDSYISSCHTGITTGAHGLKLGNWGGAIINTAFDRNIQWFDFSSPAYPNTGPVKFLNCYGENVWRLGNFGAPNSGANRDTNIEFDHCSVKFNHNEALGIPANLLSTTAKTYTSFNGGFFAFYIGAFSIQGIPSKFSFDNGVIFECSSDVTQEYERKALNATGGGILFSLPATSAIVFQKPKSFFVKHTAFNGTTRYIKEVLSPTLSSAQNIPEIYSRQVIGSNSTNLGFAITKPVELPFAYTTSRTKTQFDNIVLNGRDLTITLPSVWNNELAFYQRGGLPGDVLVDNATGSVFYIYSRIGFVIKAKLQNNYRTVNGVTSFIV
ncbi:MAG TPA: glycosyl hydrolase family 28-related protein, partial [Dyadobacter sp.]|nr:glycosyl hydrolase family 28-related protein [Dyadobacter sp.]